MSDVRPDIGPALALLGLPATVTLPGQSPVATTGIWLSPVSVETTGVLVSTDRPQSRLSLPRAAFPSLPFPTHVPRGTLISVAAMNGGPVLTWIVEGEEDSMPDELRVVVSRT